MIEFTFHEVETRKEVNDQLAWVESCLNKLFQETHHVQYVFCTDDYLKEMNGRVLNHDYFTDIITFDLRDKESDPLEAEIYISLDRVAENSATYNCTFADEIRRVLVHGLLHLSGLGDATEEEKQHMRQQEDYFLTIE